MLLSEGSYEFSLCPSIPVSTFQFSLDTIHRNQMCCKIPEAEKLQSYSALPSNMGFCFKERGTNPQYEGLVFVSHGGRVYKSFETCFFKSRPAQDAIDKFYSFVGLKAPPTGGRQSGVAEQRASHQGGSGTTEQRAPRAKPTDKGLPMTPRELWVERCGSCQNCVKPDCQKCICCRGNTRDPTARNCCLQKARTRRQLLCRPLLQYRSQVSSLHEHHRCACPLT